MHARGRLPWFPALLVGWSLALSPAACRGGRSAAELARITAVSGPAGAVQSEHRGVWRPAGTGQPLFAGDAVRTGGGASAALRFGSGGQVRLSERSLIRLGVDAASSVHVTVELGQADIEGDGVLTVNTPRGPAILDSHTRLLVRVADGRAAYEVSVGRAVLGQGIDQLVLSRGDGMALAFGSAEVERYRVEVGSAEVEPGLPARETATGGVTDAGPQGETTAAAAAAAEAAGAAAATTAAAAVRPERTAAVPAGRGEAAGNGAGAERTPSAYDVTLPAGESAVIHGRQPPLLIRLRLEPACPAGGGAVILAGKSRRARDTRRVAEGQTHAIVTVPAGAWGYRYQCQHKVVRTGTLTVRRDRGTERLAPPVAPTNTIDADGRRYTVLYQTRLPSLTFTWPGAPPAAGYTLHLEGKGRSPTYPSDAPRLRLGSGMVGEGTYVWWLTAEGGASSPRTTVTVRFDNAAVAAQVDTPMDGAQVAPGGDIEIAGVAIEGSTVAAGVSPLEMDAQGRFRGRIAAPAPDERSIAIRLVHPKGGVHYYVRRIVRM